MNEFQKVIMNNVLTNPDANIADAQLEIFCSYFSKNTEYLPIEASYLYQHILRYRRPRSFTVSTFMLMMDLYHSTPRKEYT